MRQRAIELFYSSKFENVKNKRDGVSEALAGENIFISGRGLVYKLNERSRLGKYELPD